MGKLKLGFCPTMKPYANLIGKKIKEIELVEIPSAAMVMNYINYEKLDMALIGREAYSRELSNSIKKRRLKNGYTLVYSEKVGIPEDQLKEILIKTYLPENIVKKVLPGIKNVEFYKSLEECEKAEDYPMLIDWKDFKDSYELLIPLKRSGGKSPVFRAPIIYYRDNVNEEIIKKIESII